MSDDRAATMDPPEQLAADTKATEFPLTALSGLTDSDTDEHVDLTNGGDAS